MNHIPDYCYTQVVLKHDLAGLDVGKPTIFKEGQRFHHVIWIPSILRIELYVDRGDKIPTIIDFEAAVRFVWKPEEPTRNPYDTAHKPHSEEFK